MSDAKVRGDHVVYDYSSPRETLVVLPDEQLPLVCGHCGEVFIAKLPMPLRMAALVMREFGRMHRGCKVYGPPAAQVPSVNRCAPGRPTSPPCTLVMTQLHSEHGGLEQSLGAPPGSARPAYQVPS